MRTTPFTGMAFDGTNARYATIVPEGNGYAMVDSHGNDMGDPFDYEWTTLSRARRAALAGLHEDGRRSASAVPMLVIPARMLTDKAGKLRGRFGAFEAFVASWFDESGRGTDTVYKGETLNDRIETAIAVLTQKVWEE